MLYLFHLTKFNMISTRQELFLLSVCLNIQFVKSLNDILKNQLPRYFFDILKCKINQKIK